MLYGLIVCVLAVFVSGMAAGIAVVRYGIGLGSRLHVRAKEGISINEDIQAIEQEFTK
jgi:hypothetical protein